MHARQAPYRTVDPYIVSLGSYRLGHDLKHIPVKLVNFP